MAASRIQLREPESNRTSEGVTYGTCWLSDWPELPKRLRNVFRRYFLKHGRDFAWRITSDPYQILVAEVLLQKTGSAQVEKVWQDFIQKYPDVKSLAAASVSEIVAIIESLGLRKRAGTLSDAARLLSQETGGKIIPDKDFLMGLPGVGTYTAAAISSFAFDVGMPTIDVNAVRVYSRIGGFLYRTPRQGLAFAEVIGGRVVTKKTHKEVNYGVLDLASEVCKPQPHCEVCPALKFCQFARARN